MRLSHLFSASCLLVVAASAQTKAPLPPKTAQGGYFPAPSGGALVVGGSDNCSSAAASDAISGTGTFAISTVGATNGTPDAAGCVNTQLDVWFYWTATASGPHTVAFCGGVTADTVITVWADGSPAGTCPTTSVGCNDDSCGLQSSVTFSATSGQSFFFQMGAFGATTTYSGTFSVTIPLPPPANDDCATPVALPAGPQTFAFDNSMATTGAQGQAEAICLFFGTMAVNKDTWWTWTPTMSGSATVSTCGQTVPAGADTKISIYNGTGCPTGPSIACNDDAGTTACPGAGLNTIVTFSTVCGQTYTIQLGQFPVTGNISGMATITETGSPCIPGVIHPIAIDQIDWDTAWTGVVPLSEYGHVQFGYVADPSTPRFCNIVARQGIAGADQWIVQNLLLPDAGSLGVGSTSTCTNIDLRLLGAVLGVSSAGQPVIYTAYASSAVPLTSMPPNTLANTAVIGSRLYQFGLEESIVPVVPTYVPPQGPQNKVPWDGTTTLKLDWRRNLPNEEQGTNQCGPAALANSFHWMENEYFPLVDLNGQTWVQTLMKLKTYTNWSVATGIGQRDAIEGKLLFGQDPTKIFVPGLIVKYEADAGLTDLGASVTVGTETADRHGPSMAPTFDWLLSELQHGEDVEVSIDWLTAGGVKRGGHVASIAGAARFGNKMFVWTNDDARQGPKDSNGNPPANGGLRTNMFHQVTFENGGYMRFNGFASNNRIKATYSESLEEPPPSTEKCGNGDPNRIPCPCGNNGNDPHAGCANSINPAGAALSTTGHVALDDVVLHATGMSGAICVFFRTDGRIIGGVPFGDGVTCTGGSLLRLRAVTFPGSITSVASFPVPPETVTLSARSGTFPGSGVRYQYGVFYRNAAAAFCPPFTFNTADTEEILW